MRMNKLLKIVCGLGAIVGMVGFWGEPSWGVLGQAVDPARPASGEGWVRWYNWRENGCAYVRWHNRQIDRIIIIMKGSECDRLVASEDWRNLPSHIPPNGEGLIFFDSAPALGCVYARWVNSKVIQIMQRYSSFSCAVRPSYKISPPTGSEISEIIVDSSLPSSGSGWVWENRPHSCVFGTWADHRMRTVRIRSSFRCEALVESTYRTLSP